VPGITFDQEGVCCFCRDAEGTDPLLYSEQELVRILDSVKAENHRYDAIVPVSGGRDSSFVLYAATEMYGLNVVAVNNDNEFRTDQALANIQNACQALGVELVLVRSKRDVARKYVHHAIRRVLSEGLFAISQVMCLACTYGYMSAAMRTAAQYDAPLILWGSSENEATEDWEASMTAGFPGLQSRKLLNANTYLSKFYLAMQRAEFHVPGNPIWGRGMPVLCDSNIQEIRFFDYVTWDRELIKQTITEKLGWEKPEESVSSWRIDCVLHPLMNYCYVHLLGCSKDSLGYCKMINDGQMTREEALAQEEALIRASVVHLRETLENDVKLSPTEIEQIRSFETQVGRDLGGGLLPSPSTTERLGTPSGSLASTLER